MALPCSRTLNGRRVSAMDSGTRTGDRLGGRAGVGISVRASVPGRPDQAKQVYGE